MARVAPLPSMSDPWTNLLARDDVRLVDGMLHTVHDTLPVNEAAVADLLAVADALAAHGIDVLLVRDAERRDRLVIDVEDGSRAYDALCRLGTDEPFYARTPGEDAVPLHTLAEPVGLATVNVFRPRVTPGGSLRYGSASGTRVDLWRFGAVLVEAPRPTLLTRRTMAADDVSYTTVERHGRRWRTLSGMYETHATEFSADVDMVFSWVDGSSSEFQRSRAARMQSYVVGDGDDAPARYRQIDELKYALRSVFMHAPWVRRIFIATDSPAPAWLADHPRVTIVRSEEFFADPGALPTHNSHAVEAQLHRIDGLAEHFLYSNDDMFFGRPVDPELFFSPGGVSTFVESRVRIGTGDPRPERSGHDNGLRVNRALLRERFGRLITHDLEHCAVPMRRSVAYELEREFADDYARTAGSPFRSATDISVTNSLYHYYALLTGRAIVTTKPRVRYIQTTQLASLRRMERLLARRDTDMFCLNDGSVPELPEEVRIRAIRDSLERYFPVRAPWERDEISAAPATGTSAANSR
ncbi:stealth conserved region 3 domain-containing protein [Microbacterium sp. ABRD28]|uniref:stealth family protein n=1 Tax=Microbacterium sp. ABRD28 TaxID=2268461 RepID=UPI000F555D86|nr:stealth conserved region 3 domain-containing protein [Microbacterium sp. ABRD28]AZC14374.1 sugar phosphotransferase [Microbacterium sp. ABRD28]